MASLASRTDIPSGFMTGLLRRRRRNCENARKARARKKVEVSKLQEQALQLKLAKARASEEAKAARDVRAAVERSRRQAIRKFFQYRCRNERDYKEWAKILEETFTMTLPITPYRWFSRRDVLNSTRVLHGIEHFMQDNASLALLIESLGSGTLQWRREMEKGPGYGVKLVCDIQDDDMFISGDAFMCCFLLKTTNAVSHGAKCEWVCRGVMSAKFSPMSNKLEAAEHVFDVTSLMQQLKLAIGDQAEMPVVPNTPGGACQPSREARLVTTATSPFTVLGCNESLTKLCGYSQESMRGRTLSVLQGPGTNSTALAALETEMQKGHAASSLLVNYTHDGSPFLNYLRVYPLIGDDVGNITHFLGVLQEQAEDPKDGLSSQETGPREAQQSSSPAAVNREGGGRKQTCVNVAMDPTNDDSAKTLASAAPTSVSTSTPESTSTLTSTSSSSSLSSASSVTYSSRIEKSDHLRHGKAPREPEEIIARKGSELPHVGGGIPGTGATPSMIGVRNGTSGANNVYGLGGMQRRVDETDQAGSAREASRSSDMALNGMDQLSRTFSRRQDFGSELPRALSRPLPRKPSSGLQAEECVKVEFDESRGGDPRLRSRRIRGAETAEEDGERTPSADSQSSSRMVEDEMDSFVAAGLSPVDSPTPFLAWEDVLAGPGDPLEELGALTVEKELEEVETRVVQGSGGAGQGEGDKTQRQLVQEEDNGCGRRRKGGDHLPRSRGRSHPSIDQGSATDMVCAVNFTLCSGGNAAGRPNEVGAAGWGEAQGSRGCVLEIGSSGEGFSSAGPDQARGGWGGGGSYAARSGSVTGGIADRGTSGAASGVVDRDTTGPGGGETSRSSGHLFRPPAQDAMVGISGALEVPSVLESGLESSPTASHAAGNGPVGITSSRAPTDEDPGGTVSSATLMDPTELLAASLGTGVDNRGSSSLSNFNLFDAANGLDTSSSFGSLLDYQVSGASAAVATTAAAAVRGDGPGLDCLQGGWAPPSSVVGSAPFVGGWGLPKLEGAPGAGAGAGVRSLGLSEGS